MEMVKLIRTNRFFPVNIQLAIIKSIYQIRLSSVSISIICILNQITQFENTIISTLLVIIFQKELTLKCVLVIQVQRQV